MWWIILLSVVLLCVVEFLREKKRQVWENHLLPLNTIFTCAAAFVSVAAAKSAFAVFKGPAAAGGKAVYVGFCLCTIALFLFSCIGYWKYYFKMKNR